MIILIASEGWIQSVILKFNICIKVIKTNSPFKNGHKSKMDQVILDSKTCDVENPVNLIHIKSF